MHIGTFQGFNYRPPPPEPNHGLVHAVLGGLVMAAFVVVGIAWLAAI